MTKACPMAYEHDDTRWDIVICCARFALAAPNPWRCGAAPRAIDWLLGTRTIQAAPICARAFGRRSPAASA